MTDRIDEYIGKRLHRRRRILGLTQQQLAETIGIRFQQIQKYECGANRMTAAKLFRLGLALNVRPDYFFEGWKEENPLAELHAQGGHYAVMTSMPVDVLSQPETLQLVAAYYRLSKRQRQHFLALAKVLVEDQGDANESGSETDLDGTRDAA